MTGGQPYTFTLTPGTTNGTASTYELYLYSSEYSFEDVGDLVISSGSNGDPIFPDIEFNATANADETTVVGEGTQAITYTPPDDEVDILVVKEVDAASTSTTTTTTSTNGTFGTYSVASTGYTATNLAVTVTDATTSTAIAGAEVVATGTDTGLQYNQGPTVTTTTTTGTGTTATTTTTTGLALPVPAATDLTLSTTAFGYYGATQTVTSGATAAAIALTPSHIFSTLGLQMISVPMGYSGQTIAQITLPQLDTAAVWQPTAGAYAVTPTAPADTVHARASVLGALEAADLNQHSRDDRDSGHCRYTAASRLEHDRQPLRHSERPRQRDCHSRRPVRRRASPPRTRQESSDLCTAMTRPATRTSRWARLTR